MAKILVISHYGKSLLNFRGELIKTLIKRGHRVIVSAPEYDFKKELEGMGAEFVQIPLDRTGINPISDIYTLISLAKLMKEKKPDIVFSYAIKPVIYGSLAAKMMKIPRVISLITGLGYVFTGGGWKHRLLQNMVCIMYRQALKGNNVILFQNPDDLNLFRELNLLSPKNKAVLVNGSGVDVVKYGYAEAKTQPLSFLLIARLIWDKGIGEYVEAARQVKARYPDVTFKLLGPFDSNPASIKKEQIDAWAAEGLIQYLGEVEDVCPIIAGSSVIVLPSYREGTPRSVLEAMAMGRPVITTDAPGCRETVIHGVNEFLVPIKDRAALAAAMEQFILNKELIKEMGVKSRVIAVEKYDVHKVNNVILKAMELF